MNAIKEIHGANGQWSSKRVYGALLLIVVIICVLFKVEHPLLEAMLYTGAGLIGLGTSVNIAQALKVKTQQQPPPAPDEPCG
jgi:hypothetical protein